MAQDIIFKKLDQIKELLGELEQLLAVPFSEFVADFKAVRAAERNFQLIVDLASDINISVLVEKGKEAPDTYKQSFGDLGKEGILPLELAQALVKSAQLRNILVHEYDFEEDYQKFYDSAKKYLHPYREYIKSMYEYASRKNDDGNQ